MITQVDKVYIFWHNLRTIKKATTTIDRWHNEATLIMRSSKQHLPLLMNNTYTDGYLEDLYREYDLLPDGSELVSVTENTIVSLSDIDLSRLCYRLLLVEEKHHGDQLLQSESLTTFCISRLMHQSGYITHLSATFKNCKTPNHIKAQLAERLEQVMTKEQTQISHHHSVLFADKSVTNDTVKSSKSEINRPK